MDKLIFIDTETTGLIPGRHDIIQLAAIIEVKGEVVDKINLKCQPHNWDNIDDKALEINGITREELKTFQTPRAAYDKFIVELGKYVDKWNKNDKLVPVGQNIKFDLEHLREWFKKCDDKEGKFMGSYLDYHSIDLVSMTALLKLSGKVNPAKLKLVEVAKYFGFEYDAHDALSDIEMTRRIFKEYIKIVQGVSEMSVKKCDMCRKESGNLYAIPMEFDAYKGKLNICNTCFKVVKDYNPPE